MLIATLAMPVIDPDSSGIGERNGITTLGGLMAVRLERAHDL
jgi:hypothetical protein